MVVSESLEAKQVIGLDFLSYRETLFGEMKRIVALFVILSFLSACQKESFPQTMDSAVKKVEKIINQYPGRDWYASKGMIEPETVLRYSPFGKDWDNPELVREYVSPPFRAWLIMIAGDGSIDSTDECLHLFVDADSGNYTQTWLKGQAIVEWGSTPYSRAISSSGGN